VKLRIVTPKEPEPYAIRIAWESPRSKPKTIPVFPGIIVHKASGNCGRIKRFEAAVGIELEDAKKPDVVKEGDNIIDYRNVRIRGYLSTFKSTTESDRHGDYVDEGAFRETIARFMLNPVLLTDHRNTVAMLAGNFTMMKEDKKGLLFEATLSNSPSNIDARFKIAEGMLKTTSMGGIFHYKEDGRGIFKVDLWEGSLTPIPANPDARFNVRALSDQDKKYLKTAHLWTSYYHFLEAETLLGQTMRK